MNVTSVICDLQHHQVGGIQTTGVYCGVCMYMYHQVGGVQTTGVYCGVCVYMHHQVGGIQTTGVYCGVCVYIYTVELPSKVRTYIHTCICKGVPLRSLCMYIRTYVQYVCIGE